MAGLGAVRIGCREVGVTLADMKALNAQFCEVSE
jgi:hypothetical protein